MSFVEVPADEDGDSSSLPPPPLPPKSQHVIQSSGSFSCEGESEVKTIVSPDYTCYISLSVNLLGATAILDHNYK